MDCSVGDSEKDAIITDHGHQANRGCTTIKTDAKQARLNVPTNNDTASPAVMIWSSGLICKCEHRTRVTGSPGEDLDARSNSGHRGGDNSGTIVNSPLDADVDEGLAGEALLTLDIQVCGEVDSVRGSDDILGKGNRPSRSLGLYLNVMAFVTAELLKVLGGMHVYAIPVGHDVTPTNFIPSTPWIFSDAEGENVEVEAEPFDRAGNSSNICRPGRSVNVAVQLS